MSTSSQKKSSEFFAEGLRLLGLEGAKSGESQQAHPLQTAGVGYFTICSALTPSGTISSPNSVAPNLRDGKGTCRNFYGSV